jgi:hypothetical protein
VSKSESKKIAYLFGAGATHAELTNLGKLFIEEKDGLLTKDVSARVIARHPHFQALGSRIFFNLPPHSNDIQEIN